MGIRITDLASATTVGLTDTLVLVQGGDTKKCEVSQVKTLDASEIVSGTLGVARLPVVPVSLGGTGSVDATSAVAALGAQPALTSSAPASIVQGGTGATTAVAALNALGGITSAVVPSLVTTQLSAYTLLTTSAAFQNSAQVLALASGQIAAITPASIGALATSAASGFATTAQVVGIANTAQLAAFQNSAQVRALTTAQLSGISIIAGSGLTGGGTIDASRTIALQTSGVAANIYGSVSTIPVINVDSLGRITGATSVPVSSSAGGTVTSVGATSSTLVISNSPITSSGALGLNLATTGVAAITAGSSTQSAVISVDIYGRVTSLQTQTIPGLSPTGVTAGTYGSANSTSRFTVNANGSLTGASQQVISISASQVLSGLTSAQITGLSATQVGTGITSAQIDTLPVAKISGLAASATSDTTNAGNIVTGTLSSDRISVLASSQIAGISAAQVGVGITSAQIVGIAAAQVSGLAASATTDTTNASNITTGTLTSARVGTGITSAQINTLPVAKISGLAASATTDTTVATNITTGTLAAARVGTGLTSAQILGLSAGQISTGITSAQVTGINVTQVGSLGTGVSTFLQTPSSANFAAVLTDETGSGANVFATSPTIATPTINGYTEGTVAQGTVGAAATLAITAGTVVTATLTSATPCTFTMPAVGAGKSFALYLKQPATGTATTATFTGVKWASGIAPTITAALGKMDILSFTSDGVNWYGSFIQNFTY